MGKLFGTDGIRGVANTYPMTPDMMVKLGLVLGHVLPETPWGGYKQSSIGRCHGELGFLEVTQAKVVVDDLLHRSPRNFWWLPYDEHLEEGILGAIDALFARSTGRRLRGFFSLMRSYLGSFKPAEKTPRPEQ